MIEDFAGAPELCRKVTDAATYDKCLEVLKQSDQPIFIHDVQNHPPPMTCYQQLARRRCVRQSYHLDQ